MSDAWGASYQALVTELARQYGWADEQKRIPYMIGGELLAILALYTGPVQNAVARASDRIVLVEFATEDGLFDPPIGSPNAVSVGITDSLSIEKLQLDQLSKKGDIDAARYVAAVGLDAQPWRRSVTLTGDETKAQLAFRAWASSTYEPVRDPSFRNPQLEQISFVRQMMSDYQGALLSANVGIALYRNTKLSRDAAKSFLDKLVPLGSSLDVLAENPPTTLGQDIKGALKSAVTASEGALQNIAEGAGATAAWLAEQAGKVAAAGGKGFFDNIGVTGAAVAAIAAYVYLK